MIIIHALFQVNPLKKERFLAEMSQLVAASQAEEGNISYHLYENTEDKNAFIMVEAWRDSAAVESHNASSHFQAFARVAPEFLAAPLDIKAYSAEQISPQ